MIGELPLLSTQLTTEASGLKWNIMREYWLLRITMPWYICTWKKSWQNQGKSGNPNCVRCPCGFCCFTPVLFLWHAATAYETKPLKLHLPHEENWRELREIMFEANYERGNYSVSTFTAFFILASVRCISLGAVTRSVANLHWKKNHSILVLTD